MSMFFKKKKEKNKVKKGFTLVEALLAITILMISVVAPLNLASQGLIATDIAQRKIIAFYLAQDTLEWTINKKVDNKLEDNNMVDGLGACLITGPNDYGCSIDTLGTGVVKCASLDCTSRGQLYKNSSTGTYRPDSNNGIFSGYTRFVKITPIRGTAPDYLEVKVESIVNWVSATGKNQTHNLFTNLSKW